MLRAALIWGMLMVSPVSAQSDSDLHRAAAANDIATLGEVLATRPDLEARDPEGRTALLLAVRANAIEAARLLIAQGADVNARDAIEDTPFLYAGAEGRTEILEMILAAGAKLHDTNRFGGTALIPASEKGHLANVRLLLAAGLDPNHVNRLGWTALLEAVILTDGSEIYRQIVMALIEGGADVNIADGQGVSPLTHARQRGYDAIAAVLEAAGAK